MFPNFPPSNPPNFHQIITNQSTNNPPTNPSRRLWVAYTMRTWTLLHRTVGRFPYSLSLINCPTKSISNKAALKSKKSLNNNDVVSPMKLPVPDVPVTQQPKEYDVNATLGNLTPESLYYSYKSQTSLPVIDEPVPRRYPFPFTLSLHHPDEERADYSAFQQHYAFPRFKAKLVINCHDIASLNTVERTVLSQLAGTRYNPQSNLLTIVCRALPTKQANENRVFQLLDLLLSETKTIAARLLSENSELAKYFPPHCTDSNVRRIKQASRYHRSTRNCVSSV